MKAKSKKKATAEAARGAYHYTVYFEPQTDGSFAVVFPAFPEILTYRLTPDEARAMARDASRCHLEGLFKWMQLHNRQAVIRPLSVRFR